MTDDADDDHRHGDDDGDKGCWA